MVRKRWIVILSSIVSLLSSMLTNYVQNGTVVADVIESVKGVSK